MLKALTKLPDLASVANSECHLTGIQSTIDRIMQELHIEPEDLVRTPTLGASYGDTEFSVYVSAEYDEHDEARYDFITGHKDSTIWDIKTIDLRQTRRIVCFPQDVTITIHVRIEIPLPAEDLVTLRQLGKISTEVSSPSVRESVSCTL